MSVMLVGDNNVWCILRNEYDHTQETDYVYTCLSEPGPSKDQSSHPEGIEQEMGETHSRY